MAGHDIWPDSKRPEGVDQTELHSSGRCLTDSRLIDTRILRAAVQLSRQVPIGT
jgi:hypothetical protein